MAKVFLNDALVDMEKAMVPATDTGMLYGAGLFETMRASCGEVFAIDEHLSRMFGSAKALDINLPFTNEFLKISVGQVLEANGLEEARVRLTVTAGSVDESGEPRATLLITAIEYKGYPRDYYEKGVGVVVTDYRQNAAGALSGHKTTSYYDRLFVLGQAHKKKMAEAIWFTTDNVLAEGCVSNVFVVKGDKIFTPSVETPILPGIARRHVTGAARAEGIEVEEKDLYIRDLLGADEVFLTNVIMQVLPVVAVEAREIGDGKVGQVSRRMGEILRGVIERKGQE